jgi:hypothetical protein
MGHWRIDIESGKRRTKTLNLVWPRIKPGPPRCETGLRHGKTLEIKTERERNRGGGVITGVERIRKSLLM